MDLNDLYKKQNVVEGIYYGQNDRVDELNNRMNDRKFSDTPMKPNYDPRPTPTKYAIFPIVDRFMNTTENRNTYLEHNVEINFAPSTRKSHCSGYFSNIDNEMNLRNQTSQLQKFETTNTYIPSNNSELYKDPIIYNGRTENTEHSHSQLFETQTFEKKHFSRHIGMATFNNPTRNQMRNNGTHI